LFESIPFSFYAFIISQFLLKMKHTINWLLCALIFLNIIDSNFVVFSVLDFIKLILLVLCLYLNNRKDTTPHE
jgi:hypothetical protein